MKPLNVISLFDGKACARVALERAGIPVGDYYASEIDKYAMIVAKNNYPDIQHVGDVTKLHHIDWSGIDLLCGGSPCQGFSFAGKQLNFEDPRSALFFEFVRIWNEIKTVNHNAKFFLENVVMKQEYQDVISGLLGVKPIMVNSALVSAQNRKRLYWTNIEGFVMPEDKKIVLRNILSDFNSKLLHTDIAIEYMNRIEPKSGRSKWDFKFHSDTENDKSACVVANFFKGVPNNVLIVREATKKGFIEVNPGESFDITFSESKTRRGRLMADKSNCMKATKFDYANYVGGDVVRKFTTVECERLQTLPDNYTQGVSDTQRYKMIGNGWTIDVIVEFFKHLKS